MKVVLSQETLAIGLLAFVSGLAVWRGAFRTLLAALVVAMIVFGFFPRKPVWALLAAALVVVLFTPRSRWYGYEGFTDTSGQVTDASSGTTPVTDASSGTTAVTDTSGHVTETTTTTTTTTNEIDASGHHAETKREGFDSPAPYNSEKALVPNNTDRAEPLVLGQPYKLPSEKDDEGIHLDAGTTFLKAYKALKPDQIASMTRDTQELIATQKSLVAMLDSFGPMLKDMNKITGFFGSS